jgi:SOUL heme-binding protein
MRILLIIIIVLLAWRVAWSYFGTSSVEKPKILSTEILSGNVKLLTIAPMIKATVIVSGDQNQALNNGFRQLAWYIFGSNKGKKTIAMTAPVSSNKAEVIAMTSPVGLQKSWEEYRISFAMPSEYTLENLPEPNNANIMFEQIPITNYYVWRFSGRANATRANAQLELFQKALSDQWIQATATPILNQYNDPRTIPFMRTNERRIAK